MGPRSAAPVAPFSLNTRVMDIYYIHHYSFALDIVILWRTVLSLLRPSGAY